MSMFSYSLFVNYVSPWWANCWILYLWFMWGKLLSKINF